MKGESVVRVVKKTPDGRYVFVRDGVYFSLTEKQVTSLPQLVGEYEKGVEIESPE